MTFCGSHGFIRQKPMPKAICLICGAFWKIYIDRGRFSWNEIMQEVNRVRSVKFRWINDGSYIQGGKLYTPLFVGVLA